MNAISQQKRERFLVAFLPSFALGALNEFWTETAYRSGLAWYIAADLLQWVVVPFLVWLLVLRPARIVPGDFGLALSLGSRKPGEYIGLVVLLTLLLWCAYEPVRAIAYRFLWRHAGSFGYGNVVPNALPWRLVVVTYFSLSAALVEEIVFRGLPWAYFRVAAPPSTRDLLYVLSSALLFAATHSEQGPHGMIAAFSFGVAAALAYIHLRNLWPLIIAHFVLDFINFWPK